MEMQLEYSEDAIRALRYTAENTVNTDNSIMVTQGLLLGLVQVHHGNASTILGGLGIDIDTLMITLVDELSNSPMTGSEGETPIWSEDAKEVLSLAQTEANILEAPLIDTEHILLALIKSEKAAVTPLLLEVGADYETVLKMVKEPIGSQNDQQQQVKQSTIAPNVLVPDDKGGQEENNLDKESIVPNAFGDTGSFDELYHAGKSAYEETAETDSSISQSEVSDPEVEHETWTDQSLTLKEAAVANGLTLADEMHQFMAFAATLHKARSLRSEESFLENPKVSRTSLFAACLHARQNIATVMTKSGLDVKRFFGQVGADQPSQTGLRRLADISINTPIVWAVEKYAKRFPDRLILDILGLAYGIAATGGGRFEKKILASGGGLSTAEELLAKLIEMVTMITPPDSSSGDSTSPAPKPPTAKTHSDKWTSEDDLGYNLYAQSIAEFITHKDTDPPMVIGITAPWGQGKTSLMRMSQEILDPGHPQLDKNSEKTTTTTGLKTNENSSVNNDDITYENIRDFLAKDTIEITKPPHAHPTVWFNAWKYQSSEEIWAGLAHAILSQLTERLSTSERERFWLKLQLARIDIGAIRKDIHSRIFEGFLGRLFSWSLLALGLLLAAGITIAVLGGYTWSGQVSKLLTGSSLFGLIWKTIKNWVDSKSKEAKKPLQGSFKRWVKQPNYSDRLGFLHLVEEDMRRALKLLTSADQPAIIFIDDLDRCSPNKIAQVIEAVNLFLAGDYPGCHFVIGMDAQMVAASLEVVHKELIPHLGDRGDELGWCFMDKFVQMPFVIPQLTPEQIDSYLRVLLSQPDKGKTLDKQVEAKAEKITQDLKTQKIDADQAVQEIKKIAPALAKAAPEVAEKLTVDVIKKGARNFTDKDQAMLTELEKHLRYLSDNPRTIKRVVNLYRFHRFISWGRQTSVHGLKGATPTQIARWVIAIVRWPSFIRYLQVHNHHQGGSKDTPQANPILKTIVELAEKSASVEQWETGLKSKQLSHTGWGNDADLWLYLRDEKDLAGEQQLDLASEYGLW